MNVHEHIQLVPEIEFEAALRLISPIYNSTDVDYIISNNLLHNLYEKYEYEFRQPINQNQPFYSIIELVKEKEDFLTKIIMRYNDYYKNYFNYYFDRGLSKKIIDQSLKDVFFYFYLNQSFLPVNAGLSKDAMLKKLIDSPDNIFLNPPPIQQPIQLMLSNNLNNIRVNNNLIERSSYNLIQFSNQNFNDFIQSNTNIATGLSFNNQRKNVRRLLFKPFFVNPMFFVKRKKMLDIQSQSMQLVRFIRVYHQDVVVEGIVNFKIESHDFKPQLLLENRLWFVEKYYYQIQFGSTSIPFKTPYGKPSILSQSSIKKKPTIPAPVITPAPAKAGKNVPVVPPAPVYPIDIRTAINYIKKSNSTQQEKEVSDYSKGCFALSTIYTLDNDNVESVLIDEFSFFLWYFVLQPNCILFNDVQMLNEEYQGRYLVPPTFIELFLFSEDDSLFLCEECFPAPYIIPHTFWRLLITYLRTVKKGWDELLLTQHDKAIYQKILIWFVFCIFFHGIENFIPIQNRYQLLVMNNFVQRFD